MPSRRAARYKRAALSSASDSEDSVDGLVPQERGGRRPSRTRKGGQEDYAMRTLGHPHEQGRRDSQAAGPHHLPPGEEDDIPLGNLPSRDPPSRRSSRASRHSPPLLPPAAILSPHGHGATFSDEQSSATENDRSRRRERDPEAQQPQARRPNSQRSWRSDDRPTPRDKLLAGCLWGAAAVVLAAAVGCWVAYGVTARERSNDNLLSIGFGLLFASGMLGAGALIAASEREDGGAEGICKG
ncbi:hypothetical protein JCM10213v2_000105 [Rhodosporidiobolus nylandii]